jgi:hypothetical protein
MKPLTRLRRGRDLVRQHLDRDGSVETAGPRDRPLPYPRRQAQKGSRMGRGERQALKSWSCGCVELQGRALSRVEEFPAESARRPRAVVRSGLSATPSGRSVQFRLAGWSGISGSAGLLGSDRRPPSVPAGQAAVSLLPEPRRARSCPMRFGQNPFTLSNQSFTL